MKNKSFAAQIAEIKGKTIENVGASVITDTGVNKLTLYFTDGTEIELFSTITNESTSEQSAACEIQVS